MFILNIHSQPQYKLCCQIVVGDSAVQLQFPQSSSSSLNNRKCEKTRTTQEYRKKVKICRIPCGLVVLTQVVAAMSPNGILVYVPRLSGGKQRNQPTLRLRTLIINKVDTFRLSKIDSLQNTVADFQLKVFYRKCKPKDLHQI